MTGGVHLSEEQTFAAWERVVGPSRITHLITELRQSDNSYKDVSMSVYFV